GGGGGGGRVRRRQGVPSQCAIRLPVGLVTLPVKPTAHALRADVAATPTRKLLPAEAGLGTRRHAVPFQRMITVLPVRLVRVPTEPTAQALLAEVAATSVRRLCRPGRGPGTRRHSALRRRSACWRFMAPADVSRLRGISRGGAIVRSGFLLQASP